MGLVAAVPCDGPESSLHAPSSTVGRPSIPTGSCMAPVPSSPSMQLMLQRLPALALAERFSVMVTGVPSSSCR